jgi:hypothetical protein
MKPVDFFLVGCGILYLVKPNVFRRSIWVKTSLMQRTLTPETYTLVMRILGVLMIVWGMSPLFYHPVHH